MKILIAAAALLAIAQLVIYTTAETVTCPSCNSTVETVCYINITEGRCMSMPDKDEDVCATGDDLCKSLVADQEFGEAGDRKLMRNSTNNATLRCSDNEACGSLSGYITTCIGVVYQEGSEPYSDGYCCQAINNTSS